MKIDTFNKLVHKVIDSCYLKKTLNSEQLGVALIMLYKWKENNFNPFKMTKTERAILFSYRNYRTIDKIFEFLNTTNFFLITEKNYYNFNYDLVTDGIKLKQELVIIPTLDEWQKEAISNENYTSAILTQINKLYSDCENEGWDKIINWQDFLSLKINELQKI